MRIIGITGICIFQKIKTVFYSFGKAFMQVLITWEFLCPGIEDVLNITVWFCFFQDCSCSFYSVFGWNLAFIYCTVLTDITCCQSFLTAFAFCYIVKKHRSVFIQKCFYYRSFWSCCWQIRHHGNSQAETVRISGSEIVCRNICIWIIRG